MARRLSGTTDAVKIYRAGGVVATGWPLTMACWINKLSSGGSGIILSIGNSFVGTDWLGVSVNPSDECQLNTYTSAFNALVGPVLAPGIHSIVARWVSNTERELFIDGVSVAGGTGLASDGALSLTVTEFAVGESVDSTPSASITTAQISHAAVWKAALTNDQIAMFARGVPPSRIRANNLVVYLPLSGQSTEPDLSGNGFNSTTIVGTSVVDEFAPIGRYVPAPQSWPYLGAGAYIPTLADFGEYHTILDGSASGWDQYFENIGAVIKFGSTYFMYYVAGDADAAEGDDYVHNRQLGVATSPDGVNWTKYAGNPILSFTPEGDQPEEGIGGCVAVVHDGQIHMYYTALRWRSGGDVDAEVWYCVSDDGLTFTGHTQLVENEGDEFYAAGVYVDSSDVFHVYYVGPLTGGVGDLKRLSGSTPNAVSDNGTVSTSDFSSIGGIIDLTASALLFYNDADPLDGTTTQYLMSKSALGTLGAVVQSLDPNPGALLQFSPQFLKDGDQWFYYLTLSASETAPYSNRQIICRAYPARPAFQLSPSSNIADDAATDTTAILTAPAGKTTGDFEAGKISDNTNPLPSINLTDEAYTEVEFCHEPTEYADAGGTYEFRITDNGTPLDTYTEYAEIEIEAAAIEQAIGLVTETDSSLALTTAKRHAVGLNAETDSAQPVTTRKVLTLGLPAQAGEALSLTASKVKALGVVDETELAQEMAATGPTLVEPSAETDEAHAIFARKALAIGQASETDTALVPTTRKTTATGLPSETGQALGVSAIKLKGIGLATETEGAPGVTVQGSTLLGQTEEVSAALGFSAKKVRALGIATDEQASQSLTGRKVRTISLTTETDAALGVGASRVLLQVVETESGLPIRAIKTRVMGSTQETEAPFALGTWKRLPMGLVAESQAALALYIEPAYGNVLHLTDQQLRMPSVQSERLALPRIESQALAVPTVTNESLIES